jgi:hypothetical protein
MSNPVTDEEKLRASLTQGCDGWTDNAVSTACTVCAYYCDGELKA